MHDRAALGLDHPIARFTGPNAHFSVVIDHGGGSLGLVRDEGGRLTHVSYDGYYESYDRSARVGVLLDTPDTRALLDSAIGVGNYRVNRAGEITGVSFADGETIAEALRSRMGLDVQLPNESDVIALSRSERVLPGPTFSFFPTITPWDTSTAKVRKSWGLVREGRGFDAVEGFEVRPDEQSARNERGIGRIGNVGVVVVYRDPQTVAATLESFIRARMRMGETAVVDVSTKLPLVITALYAGGATGEEIEEFLGKLLMSHENHSVEALDTVLKLRSDGYTSRHITMLTVPEIAVRHHGGFFYFYVMRESANKLVTEGYTRDQAVALLYAIWATPDGIGKASVLTHIPRATDIAVRLHRRGMADDQIVTELDKLAGAFREKPFVISELAFQLVDRGYTIDQCISYMQSLPSKLYSADVAAKLLARQFDPGEVHSFLVDIHQRTPADQHRGLRQAIEKAADRTVTLDEMNRFFLGLSEIAADRPELFRVGFTMLGTPANTFEQILAYVTVAKSSAT